ncbi:DUF2142 domain-containing protein [Vagococcus entomophilus]|uniref:DUF2142 domain-containing protein n=1 Tax=Vagococcus entomophilus TaxID=1160095 RepID=A0A430AIF0_9ENTE|nr:DUF2142 domain-containing protein [Vagococcus entomophilus]RSU07892.1 hypothetical protein CBF30_01240 [Vagococcus entomophilus]
MKKTRIQQEEGRERKISRSKSIKGIAILFLVSILFSLILEIGFFNFRSLISKNYSCVPTHAKLVGVKSLGNNMYEGKAGEGEIIYVFPKKYVSNFSFQPVNVSKGSGMFYSVMVNDKEKLTANTVNDGVPSKYFGLVEKTIVIKEKTAEIKLSMKNIEKQKFSVGIVKVENKFQFNLVRFLIVAILAFSVLIIFSFRKFGIKFERLVLLFAILYGGIFSVITPPHYTWDEFSHFTKSYSVAAGHLILHDQEEISYPKDTDKLGFNSGLEYHSYKDFKEVKNHYLAMPSNDQTPQKKSTSALLNLFIPYIFSGIGVKIALTLHLPVIFMLWLGRFMNVLFYAFMLYFSIKKIPFGKRAMAFYGLLPINLFIAASLSCDFMAMSCVFYAIAYLMDIKCRNKEMTVKKYLVLALLLSCVTIAKVTYAPVFLLMFMLGKKHFSSTKKYVSYVAAIFITGGIVAIGTYYYSSVFGLVQWSIPNVDSAKQVSGIISHPLAYLKMIYVYMSTRVFDYGQNMFGFFAYFSGIPQLFSAVIMFIFIYLGFLDSNEEQDSLKPNFMIQDKVLIIFQFLGSLVLSLTALYMTFTPVGAQVVAGFQGRYILPIFFPMIYLLNSPKIKSDIKVKTLERVALSGVILVFIAVFYTIIVNHYYS